MNMHFSFKLPGSPKKLLVQEFILIICIYFETIINFEWTYNFSACNINPKHYPVFRLLSSKSYLLTISITSITSSDPSNVALYSSLLRNQFSCTSSSKLHISFYDVYLKVIVAFRSSITLLNILIRFILFTFVIRIYSNIFFICQSIYLAS